MPSAGQGVSSPAAPAEPDLLDSHEAGRLAIRGGAVRTAVYAVTVLLSLVSVPLMTRRLGPADFGRFVAVTSLVAIAGAVAEGGLGTIGIREFSLGQPEARAALLRNLVGLRLLFSIGALVGAVVFSVLSYPGVLVAGTALVGFGALITDLQGVLAIPLWTRLRLGWVSGLELFRQATFVSVAVILVFAGAGLLPFFTAPVIAAFAALAATLFVVHRGEAIRPAFDRSVWASLLRDTLLLSLGLALASTAYRVTVVVISLVADSREAGYFATSLRVFEVLGTLGALVVGSVFPILSRAARDDRRRHANVLQKLFEVVLVVAVGLALVVGVGADFIIRVVGGPKYAPAVPSLQISAAAIVGFCLGLLWTDALVSLRRNTALVAASSGALLLALALSPPLIDAWGAKGAAAALVSVQTCYALLCAGLLLRRSPRFRPELGVVPRVGLAAGTAIAVSLPTPLPNAATTALAAAVYTAVVLLTRALPSEIWHAIPRRQAVG